MNKNSFTILNIQFIFCYFKEKGRAGPPHIEKAHAQSGVQASRPQRAWDKMQGYPRTEISAHVWSGEAGTQVSMVLLAHPIHPCVYPRRDHRLFKSRSREPVAWAQILALTLTSFVTCMHFLGPQFPHMGSGNNKSTYPME